MDRSSSSSSSAQPAARVEGGSGAPPSNFPSTARPLILMPTTSGGSSVPQRVVIKSDVAPKRLVKVTSHSLVPGGQNTFVFKAAPVTTLPPGASYIVANPGGVHVVQQRPNATARLQTAPAAAATAQPPAFYSGPDSSTTPDSGIQSVPGTPIAGDVLSPPNQEACSSTEDAAEDECLDDFTDMPRLLPMDAEEDAGSSSHDAPDSTTPQLPSTSRQSDDSGIGSDLPARVIPESTTCEKDEQDPAIPGGLSIDDFASMIAKLAPDKAAEIASLINKKITGAVESRSSSRAESECTRKRSRNNSSAGDDKLKTEPDEETPKCVEEEQQDQEPPVAPPKTSKRAKSKPGRKKNTKPLKSPKKEAVEPEPEPKPSTSAASQPAEPEPEREPENAADSYRTAVKLRLRQKIDELFNQTVDDLGRLRIVDRGRYDFRGATRTLFQASEELAEMLSAEARGHKSLQIDDQSKVGFRALSSTFSSRTSCRLNLRRPSSLPSHPVPEEKPPKPHAEKPEKHDKPEKPAKKAEKLAKRRKLDKSPESPPSDVEEIEPEDYEEMATCMTFGGAKPPGWVHPASSASCGCQRVCGEACLHRMMRLQCSANCNADKCNNKSFNHPLNCLYVGKRHRDGHLGVYTRQPIAKSTFLCEYAGEVVEATELVRRMQAEYKHEVVRAVALASRIFIDSTMRGNVARFLVHKCEPNAELQAWLVNGRLKMGVFAIADITPKDEITVSMAGLCPQPFICMCDVCGSQSTKAIYGARHPFLASADGLPLNVEKHVHRRRVFLLRNRTLTINAALNSSTPARLIAAERLGKNTTAAMRHVLRIVSSGARRSDGSLPFRLVAAHSSCVAALRAQSGLRFARAVDVFAQKAGLAPLGRALAARYLGRKRERDDRDDRPPADEKRGRRPDKEAKRRAAPAIDYSYLDDAVKVAAYEPDDAWPTTPAQDSDDAVKCVCGSLEEDGAMVQCDECHFWLHADCVGVDADDTPERYACAFCSGEVAARVPSTDVQLPSPEMCFHGCAYFKALLNTYNIQVRVNESVYIERMDYEEHKNQLKISLDYSEDCLNEGKPMKVRRIRPKDMRERRQFDRRDVGVMRVERLLMTADGRRWIFGFYYARPHETFCSDPNKAFHTNEVLTTTLYDTLPLDAVVGRCMVLPANIWKKGTPTVPLYREIDILFCEYEVVPKTHALRKMTENQHYFVSTHPLVFNKLAKPREIKRTFRPFAVPATPPKAKPQTPRKKTTNTTASPPKADRTRPVEVDDSPDKAVSQAATRAPFQDRQKRVVSVLDRLRLAVNVPVAPDEASPI